MSKSNLFIVLGICVTFILFNKVYWNNNTDFDTEDTPFYLKIDTILLDKKASINNMDLIRDFENESVVPNSDRYFYSTEEKMDSFSINKICFLEYLKDSLAYLEIGLLLEDNGEKNLFILKKYINDKLVSKNITNFICHEIKYIESDYFHKIRVIGTIDD